MYVMDTHEQTIDISQLTCWYQPIYNLGAGSLYGYEALVRYQLQHDLHPLNIFEQVRPKENRSILDCQLMIRAQRMFNNTVPGYLFLNIFPSTLIDSGFISWWDKYSNIYPHTVLEISGCERISDWEYLKSVVIALKRRGVRIAVDDMGSSFSFLKYWVELKPDYVKLDRYYTVDLTRNVMKQRILDSLVNMSHGISEVIVVGVEDMECLEAARQLGASYAQGYILGKPAPIEKLANAVNA